VGLRKPRFAQPKATMIDIEASMANTILD